MGPCPDPIRQKGTMQKMANNFTFYSPTEIVFGRGVQTQAADYLRKYGATKVLVVYGSERVVKNGLLDSILNPMKAAGLA